MANVRDSDTSLWLHNKLGTSNDSWTGGSICSQLNAEVLRNIKDCFPDLQTQVKLKLLLSFFHIPRRNIEEWRIELEQIIDVAVSDSELWVSMLAEALKTFPATGSLNTEISDLDDVRPIFTDLVNDLKRLVKKQAEHVMLPMECHYLNKVALVSVVGQQPGPTKHFTLRKKPKSAFLRADLLQKSNDAASNLKKASAPVIPVRSRGMPRKMTDTTPLKGIPSRVPSGGFRALNNSSLTRPPAALARPPAGRKEGGVKLLDIADQPLGYAAKKRKKMQEIEDAVAAATATAAAAAAAAAATAILTTTIKKEPVHNSPTGAGTPDYALGLTTPTYAPATPQPTIPPTVSSTLVSPPTPSSVTPTAATPTASTPATVIPPTLTTTPTPTLIKATTIHNNHTVQSTPTPITIVTSKAAAQQLLQQQQGNIVSAITVPAATAAAAVAAGAKLVTMPAGTVLTATKQQLAVAGGLAALSGKVATTPAGTTATIIRQIPVSMASGGGAPTIVRPVPPLLATSGAAVGQMLTGTAQNPIVVTRPVQQVTQIRLQPQPAAVLQRRGLALTRDQMIEAQEMFRTANKVTRPEKALILGFMAGSRDNPCPHLGNIVTIKLSEDHEDVMQTDNTFVSMLVETHFQMNYNNGEWKRIKKYRHMEPSIDQLTAGGAQQAAGLV